MSYRRLYGAGCLVTVVTDETNLTDGSDKTMQMLFLL